MQDPLSLVEGCGDRELQGMRRRMDVDERKGGVKGKGRELMVGGSGRSPGGCRAERLKGRVDD